jgi:hypothetical protein
MTNEEKQNIFDYLGWHYFIWPDESKGEQIDSALHKLDGNDMALAINKMSNDISCKDWIDFQDYAYNQCNAASYCLFEAWLFGNPETFFKLLGEWLKCRPEK